MESNEGFDRETLSSGSFSDLLDSGNVLGLDAEESFTCPSSFSTGNLPKMFCFENVCNELERGYNEAGMVVVAAQKSGCRGNGSSNSSSNSFSNLQKSQSGDAKSEQIWLNESVTVSGTFLGSDTGTTAVNRQTCKRTKKENPASSTGLIKVRKEKLGERITALQQLVSPFGKTDTASVLHEAMGYIRFLHDQVQVLSSPYLQRLPSSATHLEGRENEEDELRYDLRSRGLCLVPIACTAHVENSINGADFWSPAMRRNSSSKH